MADYYPLISRAVAALEKNNGENRRAVYERARTALLAQLRGVTPALEESDITRERLALEESIRKVEAEAARQFVEASRQMSAAKIRQSRQWDEPPKLRPTAPPPGSRPGGRRSGRRPRLRGATSARRRRRKKVRPLRRKRARAERGCRGQRRAPTRSSTGRRPRRNRRRRLRAKPAPRANST